MLMIHIIVSQACIVIILEYPPKNPMQWVWLCPFMQEETRDEGRE